MLRWLEASERMKDDHYDISQARNDLCDALKALLNPDIMTGQDFARALDHTVSAARILSKLVSKSDDPRTGAG